MSLYEETRELHHACEKHPLGQLMVKGMITPQQWASWLSALWDIHEVIDQILPRHMHRGPLFHADFAMLYEDFRVNPDNSKAARAFAIRLEDENEMMGACYVLHGAHRRGGRAMQPVVTKAGLPCCHLFYADPKAAETMIVSMRGRSELVQPATNTFSALLRVMDEVYYA